jgi:hypothetical protein
VLLLRTVIEQAELQTRQKLLEIQYEMAELKEAMSKQDRKLAPASDSGASMR